ncbi:hypothetical protein D9M73_263420 [compost metagenome]
MAVIGAGVVEDDRQGFLAQLLRLGPVAVVDRPEGFGLLRIESHVGLDDAFALVVDVGQGVLDRRLVLVHHLFGAWPLCGGSDQRQAEQDAEGQGGA